MREEMKEPTIHFYDWIWEMVDLIPDESEENDSDVFELYIYRKL